MQKVHFDSVIRALLKDILKQILGDDFELVEVLQLIDSEMVKYVMGEYINPTQGVFQGDPISSFLFCLYINEEIQQAGWFIQAFIDDVAVQSKTIED